MFVLVSHDFDLLTINKCSRQTLMTSKITMKIPYLKICNFIVLTVKICSLLFLSIFSQSLAHAENIENLQKNASMAYEKMMKAKQSAETLAQDAAFAEKKLASVKQKLSAAEQEAEAARKKSEQAKILMEQATSQWKQATDVLANEWGKTERR